MEKITLEYLSEGDGAVVGRITLEFDINYHNRNEIILDLLEGLRFSIKDLDALLAKAMELKIKE